MVLMLSLRNFILLALLCSYISATGAGKSLMQPSNAPVNIYADRMQYDMKSGVSEYHGNVRVTQNNIELTGDKVIAHQENEELKNIRVEGSPAIYRQLSEDGKYINAQSMRMEYFADTNRLVLTKKARLEQAGQIVESEKIVYDTVREIIIAGNDTQKERVNITITPDTKKQQ